MKTIFNLGALLIAAAALAMSQTHPVQVIEGAGLPVTFSAQSENGAVALELRGMRLSIAGQGQVLRGDVMVLREPTSGATWWMWRNSAQEPLAQAVQRFSSGWAAYVKGDRITAFHFSTPHLWMRSVASRYPTIDAAQSGIMTQIGAVTSGILKGSWEPCATVNLRPALSTKFLYKEGSAIAEPMPRIVGVRRQGGQWALDLVGPNGDRASVTVPERN